MAEEDLKAAADKVKNGKARGDDETPRERIKRAGAAALRWMMDLMNLARRGKSRTCVPERRCAMHTEKVTKQIVRIMEALPFWHTPERFVNEF